VIDCEFEEFMSEKELKSLGQQLAYCYNVNKKQTVPVNLMVTGVGDKLKSVLDKSHCENWAIEIY
jgi:tRNA (guanine9-N1)-methyltransferase